MAKAPSEVDRILAKLTQDVAGFNVALAEVITILERFRRACPRGLALPQADATEINLTVTVTGTLADPDTGRRIAERACKALAPSSDP